MPRYKLIYFGFKGRAEPTRLIFAAAGVKYEDCRVTPDEFQELKASGKLPFGQVPVLEVDGDILPQSMTICKYIGREYGFAPTQNMEIARADAIVDCLDDLLSRAVNMHYYEKDEEKKKEMNKDMFENRLPRTLESLNKTLVARGGKYFVENKLTYADVIFFSIMEFFQYLIDVVHDKQPLLGKYAALKELNDNVANHAGIKKWLSERPQTVD